MPMSNLSKRSGANRVIWWPHVTLQYSDNSQNSLSSHGLDEEGSRSVCLSDHILRSEQSIYRLVWAWKEAAFGWSPSPIDTTLWSWEVGRLDNMRTPLPNTATTQTQPQNMHPVLKGVLWSVSVLPFGRCNLYCPLIISFSFFHRSLGIWPCECMMRVEWRHPHASGSSH